VLKYVPDAGLISTLDKQISVLSKGFDIAVSVLIMIFFIGYLNLHSELIGLDQHPIPVTRDVEEFWDLFSWIVFGALAFDIYLKYRAVRDPKLFLKKHWLDLLMLCLMPLFAGLKVAKFSVKLVKGLKMAKSGFKAAQRAGKIRKAKS
jgi:hypothetical protein